MVLLTDLRSSVKLTSVLIVLACLVSSKKVKFKHGPTGLSFDDTTNCTEFAKNGRFNPYSVLHEKWFVFYYWAPLRPLTMYVFTALSANHTKRLHKVLDGNCVLPVMWEARQVLMEDNDGYISLLVERSDRGEYWLYPVARVKPGQKITPRDVRLKQTSDNRILGIMDCAEETLLVMARLNDVPRKGHLHEAASRLGYRGRRGRSYLYQGHEWGPVGEADEEIYWDRRDKDKSKEIKSWQASEESSEDVEYLPLNKPEEKKSKPKSKTVAPPVIEDGEQCVKVMPELWNDPVPNPNPNNLRITKEELDNNETLITEASDNLKNETEEKSLETESENTQSNAKSDNHHEVGETEKPLNEQNDLESYTEYPDPENENCVVCYQSQLSSMPVYIPDRTELENINKKESTTEAPRGKILQDEVQRTEFSHTDVTNEKPTHSEVLGPDFPRVQVFETEVPFYEIPNTKEPHPEVSDAKRIVSSADVSVTEVPHDKKVSEKSPSAERKVAAVPAQSPQDMTNSSEVIIMTPKKLDDIIS